ncbi:MAG: hypothetical protein M1831_005418 [Alyxoria varia]|nr:MAG: hypothetical protein M1831_005418 [Alyxoria varia]
MKLLACLAVIGIAQGAAIKRRQDYFQTSPELYAGPTPTGKPAFLAQTNPAPFPHITYLPPEPLETQVPIFGAPDDADQDPDQNIFHLHGQLSHYFPNPTGFGVDEHPLPDGAEITQVHVLHRHGARYPTETSDFVQKLQDSTGNFEASGELQFLNGWKNKLGEAILTPVGKQELFDSGTLHQYLYGHLYPNDGEKIIARSTTQDRMTQSAEYFLAGFFGLEWPKNATLELIIEREGFNNSLAGYEACPNSEKEVSESGDKAAEDWASIYLENATERLNALISPANFLTTQDVYDMQSLCAYETVALGYSAFCSLFTHPEWRGYEYSVALSFAGNNAFASPTGRAVGIGWVAELRARLQHRYLTKAGPEAGKTQVNTTLDGKPATFPLDQSLYFDFSHDTNIVSDLVALGLKRFAQFLPADRIVEDRELRVSHITPFAARLDIEVIETKTPVDPDDCGGRLLEEGTGKLYVHMMVNQRTLPLDRGHEGGYEECEGMRNGWCEMGSFLAATEKAVEDAKFDYACNGEYEDVPYGTIKDGAPLDDGKNG